LELVPCKRVTLHDHLAAFYSHFSTNK
jgi:hypothetical protein